MGVVIVAFIVLAARAPGRFPRRARVTSTSVSRVVQRPSEQSAIGIAEECSRSMEGMLRGSESGFGGPFGPTIDADGVVWSAQSLDELRAAARELGAFFIEPRLDALSARQLGEDEVEVQWRFSGTWPTAWRPRLVLLGSSTLTLGSASDGSRLVVSMRDTLEQPLAISLVSQVLPNWEDVYNLFNTPPAEAQPWTVESRGKGFEIRQLPPTCMLQIEETRDLAPDDRSRVLSNPMVPSIAFAEKKARPDAQLYAVRPLAVEPLQRSSESGRFRWSVPVPSIFGMNWSQSFVEPTSPSSSASAAATAQLVVVPGRRVAVQTFSGKVENDEAVYAAARTLADKVRTAGERPRAAGSSEFQFAQFNTKVIFDVDGKVALAQYQGTLGPLRRNEVSIELEPSDA